jgi:hypothetical protein
MMPMRLRSYIYSKLYVPVIDNLLQSEHFNVLIIYVEDTKNVI